ncbi:MAG: hypothetical protein HY813_01265 [Candidatus Portnoybacteria bacterium]|nr:hypothetical protein [Candidatus Portnoybacteria bacterium]
MTHALRGAKVLYAVYVSFVGKPDFHSRYLSVVVKMLSGWHKIYKSGLMLPLIEEPTEEIEKKMATIDLSHCATELYQLYGFFIDKERGESCEDHLSPHMHFAGGGIEEIGAIHGAFYLPSITWEACVDEKINALLGVVSE